MANDDMSGTIRLPPSFLDDPHLLAHLEAGVDRQMELGKMLFDLVPDLRRELS